MIAALNGLLAYFGGVGPFHTPLFFGAIQILLPAVAVSNTPRRAPFDNAFKFVLGNFDEPLAADAGRDPLEKPVNQFGHMGPNLIVGKIGCNEAHAAVDVKA